MIRRFNRFELKYIIPAKIRDMLVGELQRNMVVDEHGDGQGCYRLSSLYYDTPNYSAYWSKIEGIKYRRKLRLRTYGTVNDPQTHLGMVEIKQRLNKTVQKRRLATTLPRALALCRADRSRSPFESPEDEQLAQEVEFLVLSQNLQPACHISYLRQAWAGSIYESGLRITFDEQLHVTPPSEDYSLENKSYYFLHPDFVVMEVKVNDVMPVWVSLLLSKYQCPMRRISKYCLGLSTLLSLKQEVIFPKEPLHG